MIVKAPAAPALADIRAAANALAPYALRTPLLPLHHESESGDIFLKLENLQSVGAFKIRPVANILLNAGPDALHKGVYTASSGNAGLAMTWMARKLGLTATVYAPESAPLYKIAAISNAGARIELLPDRDWWQIIKNGGHASDPGLYIDAVRDPLAITGNGTIGLEIIEQCPEADTVVMPFGGGGLSCGIAAAIRALKRDVRIIVAECDTATPLTSALRAGRPVPVETTDSFISGAGAPAVLDEMWPLINQLIDDSVVVPVTAVADAMRLLFGRCKVVAEGAGAIAVAGALSAGRGFRKTVCIVSGGNIDAEIMARILRKEY